MHPRDMSIQKLVREIERLEHEVKRIGELYNAADPLAFNEYGDRCKEDLGEQIFDLYSAIGGTFRFLDAVQTEYLSSILSETG